VKGSSREPATFGDGRAAAPVDTCPVHRIFLPSGKRTVDRAVTVSSTETVGLPGQTPVDPQGPSAQVPLPPLALAQRVCSLEGRGDPYRAYERLGAQTKAALLEILPDEWSFEGKRVLDFGCGAGRTLRHFLRESQRAQIWGTDIDARSIEWLQGNLCPPERDQKPA
jgi:hypothetical protein